jgi:hypothetical protein
MSSEVEGRLLTKKRVRMGIFGMRGVPACWGPVLSADITHLKKRADVPLRPHHQILAIDPL